MVCLMCNLIEKPQPHHKEEDGEMGGAEERRRELAEEEMEQAGQPQKLEEEFDVAHNEVEEEEPQANQPDENALEREQGHAHEVRPPKANIRAQMPKSGPTMTFDLATFQKGQNRNKQQ